MVHAQDDNGQPVEGRSEETTPAMIQSSHRKERGVYSGDVSIQSQEGAAHPFAYLSACLPIVKVSSVSVPVADAQELYNGKQSAILLRCSFLGWLLRFFFQVCHVITAQTHLPFCDVTYTSPFQD